MMYLNLCLPCQKKAKQPRKGLVVRPMVFDDMNCRAQVDLMDMQSQSYGGFDWIMVYQDHLTKFVQLRSTKSKRAAEIPSNRHFLHSGSSYSVTKRQRKGIREFYYQRITRHVGRT